ncbi:MAG: tetratricopeptide repeat protein [Candidatus Melainabacteria bacterium]|nr:tetratricopeptide repeat protein [Candidatus Melainabacteria bacterium]
MLLYTITTIIEEAEKIAIKAFEFAKEIVGMNHSMTFSSLDDLIEAYKANLKYKEAIMLIECVLSVYSSLTGFDKHKLATLNLDLIELRKFIPPDSNNKLLPPVEIISSFPKTTQQEQLSNELKGHDSLMKVARTLVGTAFSYSMQHKFDEAEKLMKDVVSICEEAEGSPVIDSCKSKQAKNKEEEQDILIAELFESNVSSHEPFHWPPQKITSKKKLLKKAYAFG